jgi:hypothetical protein
MKPHKIDFILQNLSKTERDKFLREILDAQISRIDIQTIILSWEATAEINSLLPIRKKILSRSKKLKHFLLQNKNA